MRILPFILLSLGLATAAAAKPALWKLSDPDTTIYLFGTIHLLGKDQKWFEGPVREAYEKAGELVVETQIPDAAAAQAAIARYAFDPAGKPLAETLPPPLAKRLAERMAMDKLPPASLDHARPWFAAVTIEQLAYARMGLDGELGVDRALTTSAGRDGKRVTPLEGFEEQIAFIGTLDRTLQVKLLQSTLTEIDEASREIDALVKGWQAGDIDGLAKAINDSLNEQPALRAILLDQRNARWADWVAKRLDRPGVVFVAVGAGHLGGKHNLRALLAAKGYKLSRVQ